MKKKLLECPIHGLSLHRCKRRYWIKGNISHEYTEKCYKCISEGNIKKIKVERKKAKHRKI